MIKKIFSSAYVEVFSEDIKGGEKEYYLRLNGIFEYEIDKKQFLDLLEVAEQAKEELGELQ